MQLFDDDGLYCGPEYDNDPPACPTCHDSLSWEDCHECGGEGVSRHDCGDDTCCCLYPDDDEPCDTCGGHGGWYRCLSRHEGRRWWLPSELTT